MAALKGKEPKVPPGRPKTFGSLKISMGKWNFKNIPPPLSGATPKLPF